MFARRISILGYTVATLVLVPVPAAAQAPDAAALLRGVQQAREPLAGTLRISLVQKTAAPRPREASREYEIQFDRDQRRFVQEQRKLMVSGKDKGAQNKVDALDGDIDRAAAAGVGKVVQSRTRVVYDGSQLATYWEQGGAYIVNHKAGSIFTCFDPRVLGIARAHQINYHLDECLGISTEATPSVIGEDKMNGHRVWHVKVAFPKTKVDYHFWIEDAKGFRVHRYEYRSPGDNPTLTVVAVSDYGTARDRPPLPSKVVVTEKNSGGESERTYTVTEANYGVKPDPALFGLKGLEMPPGESVMDERIHQSAGYWTGDGLSRDYKAAVESGTQILATQAAAVQQKDDRQTMWIVAAVAVAVLALGVLAYRRFFRKRA